MECNMHIGRSDLGRNFSTDLGLVQISEKSWKLKTSKIAHWKCLISPNMCQKIAEKRAFRTRYDLSKMCPVYAIYIGARRVIISSLLFFFGIFDFFNTPRCPRALRFITVSKSHRNSYLLIAKK